MIQELMQYLEESIAEIAIREKLDPTDILVNGIPISLCQEATTRLFGALGELGAAGVIRNYSPVVIPRGDKMMVRMEVDLVGHIEKFEILEKKDEE